MREDRYTISGIGYGLDGKVHHAAGTTLSVDDAILPYIMASDAKLVNGKVVGDPTEGALLVLAHKAGLDIEASREALPRLATLPFDPTYKMMATFNTATDASGKSVVRCFVKGAAPAVLERAATTRIGGASVTWDETLKQKADGAVERMEGEGYRVMAAAVRDLDPATFDADGDLLSYVTDLEMASLVAMVDPPRDASMKAVHDAQNAGIRVRMVTGDDVITGAAIAQQLGIPGTAMLGADFAALSDEERLARIDDIGVVGRVAPEHKVLLVQTLRKKGDVVAMAGDGVNDAPAIKTADIGIAMGTGTQVAKNASRMILSDDNYATIVVAVRGGRKVYDNLNKFIRFVIVELVAYILTFLGASILNIAAGQPFSPGTDPVHQLLRQRTTRRVPRLGQRGARPDESQATLTRRVDHDEGADDHRRPRRPVHGRLHPRTHQLRHQPLRQPADRHLDGRDDLLIDDRRRRLRGQKCDRHGRCDRVLRQPPAQHHRARGALPRCAHHPDGFHAHAARHRAADDEAVVARVGARHRAVDPLGDRQADRAVARTGTRPPRLRPRWPPPPNRSSWSGTCE